MAIKDSSIVRWPPRLNGDPATRNWNVYYHFHQDHGHSTENCGNLCDEIGELTHRGYQKNYILREEREQGDRQEHQSGDQRRNTPKSSKQNEQPPRQLPEERPLHEVINMITKGSISVGCTSVAGGTLVRELENEGENPPKRPRLEEPIYFTEDDVRGIQHPHDDALVIKLRINDFEVKRILVDSGSSTDILFKTTFDMLQL
ncbi:PREDICTED: uncharacterized protein LOC104603518 [Nelumbo nucifera]|uniref:Uncharacterized protein LOC104603518 n=1 Tax=Nelumbo nucifera TaxID=4432 RepID=A0A1U8ASS7_NELNU|nr:PREDICTED: uncharacterized protein LOC104603518 [Nelumbo nucifera]